MNMHAGARGSRAQTTRVFVQINPDLVRRLAAMVEAGIALLDELDGDPDMEPGGDEEDDGGDEPSLGAPEPQFGGVDYYRAKRQFCPSSAPLGSQAKWAAGGSDDREEECEDEGAQCDDEGDQGDNGLGDADGYAEQIPSFVGARVE